jgi:hypothetical protein
MGRGRSTSFGRGALFSRSEMRSCCRLPEKDEEGGSGLGAIECTRAGVVDGDEEIGTSEKGERP